MLWIKCWCVCLLYLGKQKSIFLNYGGVFLSTKTTRTLFHHFVISEIHSLRFFLHFHSILFLYLARIWFYILFCLYFNCTSTEFPLTSSFHPTRIKCRTSIKFHLRKEKCFSLRNDIDVICWTRLLNRFPFIYLSTVFLNNSFTSMNSSRLALSVLLSSCTVIHEWIQTLKALLLSFFIIWSECVCCIVVPTPPLT